MFEVPQNRALAGIALLAAFAVSVSACGVRGSLDRPPQAQTGGTATSAEGGEQSEDSAAPKKAHRGFILDGILR